MGAASGFSRNTRSEIRPEMTLLDWKLKGSEAGNKEVQIEGDAEKTSFEGHSKANTGVI